MIVNDLNLEGVRAALDETKTELIVDADAVLSGAIALQGFKVVAGRCGHGGQVVVITILHAVAPAYVHMCADKAIACSKISFYPLVGLGVRSGRALSLLSLDNA